MGKRYAAIVQEARMPGFPEEEELTKYFRNMITEEEKLDIGTAYYDGHEWPVDIRRRGPSFRMVAVSSLKRVEFKDEGAVEAFSSLF